MNTPIHGRAYVVGDNIDTDQIIPAQHLALVPTIAEEYRQLGGFALSGLPREDYPERLVEPDHVPSSYSVVIAGKNFGCGSSREHAPIALGAAGVRAVIAESFARIFFRNCIATGELYPIECDARLCEQIRTGQNIEIDFAGPTLKCDTGPSHRLRPPGDAARIIAAGGLFAYARQEGLVQSGGVK